MFQKDLGQLRSLVRVMGAIFKIEFGFWHKIKDWGTVKTKSNCSSFIAVLENMKNERDFSLLYKKVKVSASEIDAISSPALPRKRIKPNY